MIAMALACGPTLLFADEPTTALDVTVQAQILDLIQAQRKDRNMSVILVTHDLGVVAGNTDEIVVMYAGQVVEQAPTPVLFSEMSMPYTEALLESIPKLEDPSHTRLRAIAGRPPDLINPPTGCRFSPRCPYVQDRCRAEAPPLAEAETPGHSYACWYPVGSEVWQEVKLRTSAGEGRRAWPPAPHQGRHHRHGRGLMAGTGTAHLQPGGRRPAAGRGVGGRVPRRPDRAAGPCRFGDQPGRAARRDARHRGRVRMRQVDHWPGHPAAAPPERAARSASRGRSSRGCTATACERCGPTSR